MYIFFSPLRIATNKILLPLFSPAGYPFKVFFSSICVSFCWYFILSFIVHFYAVSNVTKLFYTTYYSLEIFHGIIPLIFFIFFPVVSEILIFFPLFLTQTHQMSSSCSAWYPQNICYTHIYQILSCLMLLFVF